MKYIKTYISFKESILIDATTQVIDLLESLSIWQDALLSSIQAEEVDIYNILNLDKNIFKDLNLSTLQNNADFIKSLSSINLKKSPVESTDDYETFINKPSKFMLIYDSKSSELENPIYILFQTWNQTTKEWSETRSYKIKDEIKKFYDKLSSKTMEIIDGEDNYIYTTTNGNEWVLQNNKESEIFKKVLRMEEMEELVKNKKINII